MALKASLNFSDFSWMVCFLSISFLDFVLYWDIGLAVDDWLLGEDKLSLELEDGSVSEDDWSLDGEILLEDKLSLEEELVLDDDWSLVDVLAEDRL